MPVSHFNGVSGVNAVPQWMQVDIVEEKQFLKQILYPNDNAISWLVARVRERDKKIVFKKW